MSIAEIRALATAIDLGTDFDDDERAACRKCRGVFVLNDAMEPSPLCDPCAHDASFLLARAILAYLPAVEAAGAWRDVSAGSLRYRSMVGQVQAMSIDLDKLHDLARKATPGPWKADLDIFDSKDGIVACVTDDKIELLAQLGTDFTTHGLITREQCDQEWRKAKESHAMRDADYIAACSPDVVIALIAEVCSLRAPAVALTSEERDLRAELRRATTRHPDDDVRAGKREGEDE